jgi:Rap1a immunity proteins
MRVTNAIIVVAMCTLATGSQADNDETSGMQMLRACEAQDALLSGICQGWMTGLSTGLSLRPWLDQNLPACLPPGLTGDQVRLIVIKFLKEHPEQLHYPASLIAGNALHSAFPCPQ